MMLAAEEGEVVEGEAMVVAEMGDIEVVVKEVMVVAAQVDMVVATRAVDMAAREVTIKVVAMEVDMDKVVTTKVKIVDMANLRVGEVVTIKGSHNNGAVKLRQVILAHMIRVTVEVLQEMLLDMDNRRGLLHMVAPTKEDMVE